MISRILRRMRLRFTALPSAFLMLQPNRLSSRPLARRKTANSRLVLRRPSRYTASYSDRRTRRAARGKSCRGVSDARETVAPLLAACRKYFPSTLALHSCAEPVLLMTAPHMRLKSAFRQRSFSSASRSISLINYVLRAPRISRPAHSVVNRNHRLAFVAAALRPAASASVPRITRACLCSVALESGRLHSVVNPAPKRNNESRRPPHIGQGTSLKGRRFSF